MTGGADILFGFIPAVEVITGLFAGRQDACAGFKLADIERSAVDLVVVLIEVVEMDRPVPVCRDNAVAGRASWDLGDLLAVLVVPLKERLAPVSTGRIGQRDGIALNRVRRGVGAGGLAVVVYILNGVLNGRKFAVELPFLGHVQLFDLSFYANISYFLIPAAEFVTIFCIRSPQAVGGIVNRVNRVHLLFYPRTGFIREVVLDCERLLFPVRVQVRPAVDGLAGDVRGLAFAAPEGEGVAVAGRSGRVCGGQSRANAGLGGTEDALRLGVVVLICRQRFQRIEVNDRNQLGDDELEILPVSGDQQLLQSGGFILQTVQIPLVAVEHAVVVPAAVDLEVEIEIAARIDLRKVNRIASKLIGGVRNIHDRLAQIAGLEDHEVDVGLFGFPLRNIGHSLRDRCRNFGLPACEGVAGAGRGAVERGGRGILPKVRIDLIGENFFVLNAVGVGDGVYLRHMYAALRLDLPAAPDPDQRDRNDLLIVLDMFRGRERLVELGHIGVGVIADVAKPVVPDLLRLADEVVFIVLAEQAVGARMLLRSIYNALDLNSHFKLFQIVSRRGFGLADDFNDRQVTLLLPFPVPVNSCFGVIAEGDGQRCVLLVNEPVLDAGGLVICHQIRRYRDRRGDVVALIVHLHIADRILRRGGNIIRLVRMCCFVVLADDSKAAVQRRGLCGRGHFMRGFDPRVRCRFHPLLIRLIIGEVERDGLRGRGVLHLPAQIAGLLHEPCRPDSHRADISARAIACDLADRMLWGGRESERILYRIMRSVFRNADNIYNNAGHVVFRGLGGLVGGWGLLAVLNLDHTQAVVQLPRVILVADYKLQRCLVRIVELMRLRFFAVVLCDIRRGLDGHVVFPRLIQSRRFRPVERLALRVVNQVVVFRPAAGRADVLYLNLPDSGFQIVIGGNRNRIAPFPNSVDGLGAVFMFNVNRAARLILRSGRSRTVSPALEGVAIFGRDRTGDGKGNPVHRWMRCRTRLTIRRTGAAIRIILQFKEWHPDGVDGLGRIVLGQYDRISARVLRSHSIRLVRPANVIISTAGQLRLLTLNVKVVAAVGRSVTSVSHVLSVPSLYL